MSTPAPHPQSGHQPDPQQGLPAVRPDMVAPGMVSPEPAPTPAGTNVPGSPDPETPRAASPAVASGATPSGSSVVADTEEARRRHLAPMGRGTLARQLALRVAGLVTLVCLLLGLASIVAVRHQLLANVDSQLAQAVTRTDHFGNDNDNSGQPNLNDRPPPGTAIGQLTVVRVGNLASGARYVENGKVSLDAATIRTLASAARSEPSTITLDGLGSYRVASSTTNGLTQIVGIPMGVVDHSLRQLVIVEAGLTLAALLASLVLAQALVRNALKPLSRLASTATEVSNLELDRGEVTLPMRVPGADANPDTEVGRVGHAFNHMLNNVEGALAARQQSETKVRQFVADASHELRNPLAAIRGYAELTRRGRDELPRDTQYAMGRIEAESERMSHLVEDMLLLARLDNDPTLELGDVDVVEVVLNAVSDARVAGPGHRWTLALPEQAVVARADALKLHQVVANLLSNARKHTPEGTTVETGVGVDGRFAVVTVTDDGPGIDPSIKDQVFERFARADTARAHNTEGSTGLGLAIVTAVMDAHGGSATVDSHPGFTRFTLHVPLAG